MPTPRYIEDCLNRKLIFFTGKGGVGKTTLAWATALACQRASGKRIAVASWSDGAEVPSASLPAEKRAGITWHPLDTLSAFREYALRAIRFDKLYDVVFENKVFRAFVLAAPGLADTVIGGKIWDLYNSGPQDLLLVDLPASGHATSFFKSPLGVSKIFSVGLVHRETEKICAMFKSPAVRLDLVTLPEELPVVECQELKENLERLHPFSFGFLHVNQCLPSFGRIEKNLGPPFAPLLAGYEERLALERRAATRAAEMGLKTLSLPRFDTEESLACIEKAAGQLERR